MLYRILYSNLKMNEETNDVACLAAVLQNQLCCYNTVQVRLLL